MGDDMNKINRPFRYYLSILLLMTAVSVVAQNPRAAQKLFDGEQFVEAAGMYAKLVRRYPGSAAYNYFYGVCLYETGDVEGALPYLQKACKRKYIKAFRYMGMANCRRYRFDEAVANYEDFIHYLEQRRRDTSAAEEELSELRKRARMMRGVKDIQVVDTFAVGRKDFLKCFRLSPQAGKLSPAETGDGVVFETSLGNMRLIGDSTETGERVIRESNKVFGKWSKPRIVASVKEFGNAVTPFMMGDGQTLYFASDREGGLGGYDIYITRYDSDEGEYLRPGNLGMPFNSQANDYMMAMDEAAGLGWFVSDRFQPEDSVCVYVFVPSDRVVDYDDTPGELMRARASLRPAESTVTSPDIVKAARMRLAAIGGGADGGGESVSEVENKFSDPETASCFKKLQMLKDDLKDMEAKLLDLRKRFHDGDDIVRGNIRGQLLDLEGRVEGLRREVKQQEKKFRILKTSKTDK